MEVKVEGGSREHGGQKSEVRGQGCSSKLVGAQSTSLHDAPKRADWDRFVSVDGNDDLAAIWVTPFLVTAFLAYLAEAVSAQDSNNVFSAANGKPLAHVSATSKTFAPAGNVTGAGSNQSSNASLALRTASSSVSPAEAHPGNSGKNAAQRFVSSSCSTTSRTFMPKKNNPVRLLQQIGKRSKLKSST
jgi:hypothetical protein